MTIQNLSPTALTRQAGQRTCLDVRIDYPRILPRIDGLAACPHRIKCQRRLSCITVSGYLRGSAATQRSIPSMAGLAMAFEVR